MTDAVLLRRDEDMSQKKWEGNPLQVRGERGQGAPSWMGLTEKEGDPYGKKNHCPQLPSF